MLNHHVFHATRAIGVVHAAVVVFIEARRALRRHVALSGQRQIHAPGAGVGALVRHAKAVDDHAAPLLDVLRAHRAIDVREGGKGDGGIGRAYGEELGAAINHHEVGVGLPSQGSARLHGHGGAIPPFADACSGQFGITVVGVTNEEAALEDVRTAIRQGGKVDIDGDVVARVSEGRAIGAVAVVSVGTLASLAPGDGIGSTGVHRFLRRRGRGRVVAVRHGVVDGGRGDVDITAAAAASEDRQRRGRDKSVLANHDEPPGVGFYL